MSNEKDDVLLVRKELEESLSRHDWYYNYSDDGGTWRRGQAHADKISGLMKKYTALVGQEEADELYNKYAPNDYKIVRKKQ
jgi:hypothetical protein